MRNADNGNVCYELGEANNSGMPDAKTNWNLLTFVQPYALIKGSSAGCGGSR